MARPIVAFYITICVTMFVLSKIVVSYLLYRKWAQKRRIIENSLSGGKMVIFRSAITQSLDARSLMKMTMGLSNKDIIGSGGHGTVYRLRIDDSTAFAMKKLNKGSTEIDRGFERELVAMGDIKHRNIVRLHGYYIAPHFNLLIYELMHNGSLDCFLHGKSDKKTSLEWPTRLRIAVGTARGIAYLHHDCVPHILHRDIKSSNILLDHNMEARISDFGLATLMQPNKSHVSTAVAGTFGYLAPDIVRIFNRYNLAATLFQKVDADVLTEYFDTGRATTKGDIYSFGVVLLELLTGKRPTDESFIDNGTNIVTWVKETVKEQREEETVDSALVSSSIPEIRKVFQIAEKCLEAEPSKRPPMAEVLRMLEQVKQIHKHE